MLRFIFSKTINFFTYDEKQGVYRGVSAQKRFIFFSKAIIDFLHFYQETWTPDILHINDWHTALVPLFLQQKEGIHKKPKTLITVHNLPFQELVVLDIIEQFGIDTQVCCDIITSKAFGIFTKRHISLLKEGIKMVDYINTVSPTYAEEILTPEYGMGMQDILGKKRDRVFGILNGIDYDYWNPETDSFIDSPYNNIDGKRINKERLMKECAIQGNGNSILIGFVGRLDPYQKGIDIFYEALKNIILTPDHSFVILGTGDKSWEKRFAHLAKGHSNFVFVGKFDKKLAHKIYAGADLVVVPSRYEPCGLIQMIAMRYGTLPLVRKTGGLADSIRNSEDGFMFEEYKANVLQDALIASAKTFWEKEQWNKMVHNAMSKDFSWNVSANKYIELYKKMLSS